MRACLLGVAVAVIGVCASPAWGAFPGRDGDLVVATGAGLELVAPGTGTARSICTSVVLCGRPTQPSFSPNGRAIAFVDQTSHRTVVVAADGSCLWCLLGARPTSLTGAEPTFTPGGQGVTVARNGLWKLSLGGGRARRLVKGRVDGAVWSSGGLVALVRRGWIWVGRPGHGKLLRLARGRSPSFSPDGVRLALAREGYVWIVRVADGTERRLVRGRAPVWSPNGREIAYVAAGGTVAVIAVDGGRPHQVGSVRGTALDWQPIPTSAKRACRPPKGSNALASNRDAVVFSQDGVFRGCLKSLGRTRVLLNGETGYAQLHDALIAVRLAGRFAAIATEDGKPPDLSDNATLYDLASGKATRLTDFSVLGPGVEYGLDSLAVDSGGFAAWRKTTSPTARPLTAVSCPSASLCVAGDEAGTILSSTNPTGGPITWSLAPVLPNGSIGGISCPSISLCVAVGGQDMLTATDPSAGASAWTKTTLGQGAYAGTISCPSVSLCVAGGGGAGIDGGAAVLTSTDPTGGAGFWSSVPVAAGDEIVDAVSCPSVSLCVAATNKGDVFTSTNPTGGVSAWTKTTIDQGHFLSAVSCPAVSLCVVTNDTPDLFISTNPAGGTSAWMKTTLDQAKTVAGVDSVSCPSVSLCVGGGIGNVLTSTDPTGGATAWMDTAIDGENDVYATSCPSGSLCVIADQSGNILASIDPTGGANTWTGAAVDIPGCAPQSIPCISEQLYARDDQGVRVVDTATPGQGNSIGNVALGSPELSWTHDGAQRQLELR
jgi:WD40-like Beta Propeller Repeat